ncbi:MAG: PQQ-binding-like beta-propeller repeat protein, partial [Thermoplasmatales archaeon]
SPMTIGFNAPLFSGRARVYAFDLNDGSKIWKTRVKGLVILSSPTVSNGKLLVPSTIIWGFNTWNRRVTSLDVKTGAEIWYYHIKQNVYYSCWPASISAPSVGYGKIFINDASGFIIALDEETGEMVWESEIIDEVEEPSMCAAVPPVIADHKVITASYERDNLFEKSEICMFNVSDGEKIWSVEFDVSERSITAPFALANGKLFVNTDKSIYIYG